MKRITIIISLFSLFIYIQPVLACDNWGNADDPILNDWAIRNNVQIDPSFNPQIFNIFNDCQ